MRIINHQSAHIHRTPRRRRLLLPAALLLASNAIPAGAATLRPHVVVNGVNLWNLEVEAEDGVEKEPPGEASSDG